MENFDFTSLYKKLEEELQSKREQQIEIGLLKIGNGFDSPELRDFFLRRDSKIRRMKNRKTAFILNNKLVTSWWDTIYYNDIKDEIVFGENPEKISNDFFKIV